MRIPIKTRAYNSGGKGGQHGNRSYNAIEASCELPDGTVLAAHSELKSQHQNRRLARARLAVKVREAVRPTEERRETAGFGPDDRVRTYHEPDDRVNDASGFALSFRQTVGRSDLAPLIEGRRERVLRLSAER